MIATAPSPFTIYSLNLQLKKLSSSRYLIIFINYYKLSVEQRLVIVQWIDKNTTLYKMFLSGLQNPLYF